MPAAVVAFHEDQQLMMGFLKGGYRLNRVGSAIGQNVNEHVSRSLENQ